VWQAGRLFKNPHLTDFAFVFDIGDQHELDIVSEPTVSLLDEAYEVFLDEFDVRPADDLMLVVVGDDGGDGDWVVVMCDLTVAVVLGVEYWTGDFGEEMADVFGQFRVDCVELFSCGSHLTDSFLLMRGLHCPLTIKYSLDDGVFKQIFREIGDGTGKETALISTPWQRVLGHPPPLHAFGMK